MKSSPFSLADRVALITGSARGLGKAMAEGLARSGAHVVLNGRSQAPLTKTGKELESKGLSVSIAAFDIADYDAAKRSIEDIERAQGSLDILINNVGYRDRREIFEFGPGDMDRMLNINLTAPFELSRLAARGMIQRKWGRIINVSSVVSQIAGPGDATYVAAKGGLESLTRALAAEFGKDGVTVNAISPGFFETGPNAHRVQDRKLLSWLSDRTALGRWAKPDEISGAAVFLASDAASYVSGHVLAVDGGMLAHL
jgi:gluconate 5-dehydrogenase